MADSTTRVIDDAITTRFACRAFADTPVPRETIEDILGVARFAPSGANTQPWKVYVLSGSAKTDISAALQKAFGKASDAHISEYQYYAPELPEPFRSRRQTFGEIFYGALGIAQSDSASRARQTAKNFDFFGAPVGMIVTVDRRLQVGSWLDLGMFIQNVLIAAAARGLRSCPQETFARFHRVLRPLLAIPENEMVVCGISLGFADDTRVRAPMPKLGIEEFATFVGFDEAACSATPQENPSWTTVKS